MHAGIEVIEGDHAREVVSLVQWLRRSRELQGRVKVAPAGPGEEELGGGFELVTVALGSGGAVAALVSGLSSWAQSRKSDVKLKVTAENRTVEIEVTRTKSPEAVEEMLRRLLSTGADV